MTYGSHNALADVLNDLWDYQDLTNLLDSADAISAGWPKDEQSFPVVVRVQPITESSDHHENSVTRTFRLQVSVVATDSWRSDQTQPTYRMAEIMHKVAQRLDVGIDFENIHPEGTAGGSWQEVTGGRVALIQDWQIRRISSRP